MVARRRGSGQGSGSRHRRTRLQNECMEDLEFWVRTDANVALRVFELMKAVRRDPFRGLGKPEPLKHLGSDVWSRRITARGRLVYRVGDDYVDFLQARYHY